MLYPPFNPDALFFLFCVYQTAITIRLSAKNPTTMPTDTATPTFIPPESLGIALAVIFGPPGVGLAVGFSVGISGNGEVGVVPLTDEFVEGA